MHQKTTPPKTAPSPVAATKAVSEPVSPAHESAEDAALARVCRLIEAGRYDEAFTLARSRSDAPMRNAMGVCLMRMGKPLDAVRIYRAMVLDHTGLFLREQAPTIYKTNYALALMLSGHKLGGLNILKELANLDHPSVEKLRNTVAAWRSQLAFHQKLGLLFGLEPKRPLTLDGPAGELA